MTKQVARALIISAALSAVTALHAFVAFDGIRIKVVRGVVQPEAGAVRARTPGSSRVNDLRAPFAVITEIENDSPQSQTFVVRVDRTVVCTRDVPGASTRRVDCAMTGGWAAADTHEVVVLGPPAEWRLAYAELATHHGVSTGLVDLRLVPRGFTQYEHVGWAGVAVLFVLCAGFLLVPAPRPLPRLVAIPHRIVLAVFAALLALVAVLPVVSPYAVVVSVRTVVYWSFALLAPRLWVIARAAARAAVRHYRPVGPIIVAPLLVAVTVLVTYRAVIVHRLHIEYHDNSSGLLVISKEKFDRNPLLKDRDDIRRTLVLREDGGYDGQFMYFGVYDPFLRAFPNDPVRYNDVMDAPPYRYGRIGFVLLTRLVAGSRWQTYPATMTWLIVCALVVAGVSLSLIARRSGLSPAWGLVVCLVPAFYQSVQVDLPEPVAAAALLLGVWCVLDDRPWIGTMLFAFSLLVRETGAVFLVCFAAEQWLRSRRRNAALMAVLAAVPFLAWHAYLGSILFQEWGMRGFFLNPHVLGVPFGGFADLWSAIAGHRFGAGAANVVRAGIWYPILLTTGFVLAVWAAARRPTAITVAAAVYGLMAVSLNFPAVWVDVGNGQRGTYELFIMLGLVATQTASYPRALQFGVRAFWVLATVYVFYGTFDAAFVQDSLLSARLW